jgi:hypothetical protein
LSFHTTQPFQLGTQFKRCKIWNIEPCNQKLWLGMKGVEVVKWSRVLRLFGYLISTRRFVVGTPLDWKSTPSRKRQEKVRQRRIKTSWDLTRLWEVLQSNKLNINVKNE